MSGRPILLLYEDDRGPTNRFGLHELIVACVADVLGQWNLRGQFQARPQKGNSKLLAACEQEVPDLPHPLFFAVFDADKLHRLLFQSGRPSDDEAVAELRRRCPDHRLHFLLIAENTETVVNAAAGCLGVPRPEKNKLERDLILNRAATGARQQRDCIREGVPSFEVCICRIAELSTPLLGGRP